MKLFVRSQEMIAKKDASFKELKKVCKSMY